MAYRNTFFRWLFLYSLTFGLTYVLKLFTYLCPETGQEGGGGGGLGYTDVQLPGVSNEKI